MKKGIAAPKVSSGISRGRRDRQYPSKGGDRGRRSDRTRCAHRVARRRAGRLPAVGKRVMPKVAGLDEMSDSPRLSALQMLAVSDAAYFSVWHRPLPRPFWRAWFEPESVL